MSNFKFDILSKGCKESIKNNEGIDFIVYPSGSCTLHIKEHLHDKEK